MLLTNSGRVAANKKVRSFVVHTQILDVYIYIERDTPAMRGEKARSPVQLVWCTRDCCFVSVTYVAHAASCRS